MSKILQENKVLFVEPNAMDDITSYSSDITIDNTTVYKTPNDEDLCIVVDLEVEVKGRTYNGSSSSSSDSLTMEWQSSTNGQSINFMGGSKIYTDSSKSSYINSLTTNYTDIFLDDIKNVGTAEMFGIKSIDISYNNYMVPEVTIQFTDVRGVSLFAQEEFRHNITRDGISATANPSIEGSFFKCFFTFPYPKFTLKVKGFYGKMVSYELTCSDFRSAFNSQTGNFNVTAKFVGYAFSFMNDVMTNAVIAAPYSTYIGKTYWEENLASRFKVTDKNGAEASMVRLGDLVKSFKNIQETVDKQLTEEGGVTKIAEELGMSEEVINATKNELGTLRTSYSALMSKLQNFKVQSETNGDCHISIPNSYSHIIVTDESGKIDGLDDGEGCIKNEIASFETALKASTNESIKKWLSDNNDKAICRLLKYHYNTENENDFKQITESGIFSTLEGKAISKYDEGHTFKQKWEDCSNSWVFVYQDFGLKDILNVTNKEVQSSDQTNSSASTDSNTNIVEQVRSAAIQSAFGDVFGFMPSVENITKIIMAHFETYVHMISTCATNIINSGSNRSVNNLGISIDNFPDTKGNGSTTKNDNIVVAPFPKVSTTITQEGVEKTEDAWIGEYGDSTKFEEIALIEGLLEGIDEIGAQLNAAAESSEAGGEEDSPSPITYPLCPLDLLLEANDKPYGDVNTSNIDDVFSRFLIRAFEIFTTQSGGTEENAATIGRIDAENFLKLYNDDTLKATLSVLETNDITGASLIQYFMGSGVGPSGQQTNIHPWVGGSNLLKSSKSKSSYWLNYGTFGDNGCSIAIKNWSFAQWIKDINHKNGIVGNELSNYVTSYTPKQGSKYINSDINANLIFIKEKSLSTIKKKIEGLKSANYYDSNLDNLFSTLIDTSAFDNNLEKCPDLYNGLEGDGIVLDDNGQVKDSSTYVYHIHDFFMPSSNLFGSFSNPDYYKYEDINSKAQHFLYYLGINNSVGFKPIFNKFYNFLDKGGCFAVPKYIALAIFQELKDFIDNPKNNFSLQVRKPISDTFFTYLDNWCQNDFKKIDNNFALHFKKNDKDYIDNFLKNLSNGDINKNQDALKNYISNFSAISNAYSLDTLKAKSSTAMTEFVEDLFQTVLICLPTKFNDNDHNAYDGMIYSKPLENYLNGVKIGLAEQLGIMTSDGTLTGTTDLTVSMTISSNNGYEDIKVGVYNYIKMLYDKWIASGNQLQDYTMEKMFYDDDCTFHFIDSFYNKVGKSMVLNVGTLCEILYNCQTANGYTLLSLFSELYSKNKFTFLCLQNFMDLSKKENMETMFKPISYFEIERPDNHPDFIVLYPYEASSKLDVEGADYPDDSFYLNDSTSWPSMITSKQETDPAIPAFGVSFGQQYQNYFQSINVDMSSPMSTEQSIKAKFLIAGANTSSENNGSRHVTVGQDLYSIYSNNSYTCKVTMLGCAWVQPMMYFVLQNVPMFRGSYMVVKVEHNIEPGNMSTTFTGVRMAKTATRTVREFIYGATNDASDGDNAIEQFEHSNANIGNDCAYAYYDPTPITNPCNSNNSKTGTSSNDKLSIDDYMSGLSEAVEKSLNVTEYYKDVKVKHEKTKNGWLSLTATGTNANNALFDCLLQTYRHHFTDISWVCNSGSVSGDCTGVLVSVSTGGTTDASVYVYDKKTPTIVKLTKAEEVNDSLKKSIIKMARNKNIKNATQLKARFKSITGMADETITNIFELNC